MLLLFSGEQILRADAEEKGRDWTAKAKDIFIPLLEFKFGIFVHECAITSLQAGQFNNQKLIKRFILYLIFILSWFHFLKTFDLPRTL